MRPMLDSIRYHLREGLQRQKDIMGFNRAALGYLRRDWEARNTAEFFDESSATPDTSNKRVFTQLSS